MNLNDYRMVFAVASLTLVLLAVIPALVWVMPFQSSGERFSELWVSGGSNHMMADYPFDVRVNGSYTIAVGVGNRMGVSSYYLVYVKFRNQTQLLPNTTLSEPSPLPPLYEYQVFVAGGGNWESPLVFRILAISQHEETLSLSRVSINDEVFATNASSAWDSEFKGYYLQLLLELWLYDVTTRSFQFDNRFVGIWMNITA